MDLDMDTIRRFKITIQFETELSRAKGRHIEQKQDENKDK